MSKFTPLTEDLHDYVVAHGAREDDLLRRLREETADLAGEMAVMQVAPEQGAFLTVLARAMGARRALEIGTFTGYSAICIARGLADDGRLLACEVSEEWAAVARRYFAEAGLTDRIDLRLAPALETLAGLDGADPFDLAFIDADKQGYPRYWEECLRLVRPGGLVVIDNVLGFGHIASAPEDWPEENRESLEAIARVNEQVVADERVDVAMLGMADGVTIARKR